MKLTRGPLCHLWVLFTLVYAIGTHEASIPQNDILERAEAWMSGNPVMAAIIDRPMDSVESFPDSNGYSVVVVQFSPSGYLVLNSDDRLPLVVSFSVDSVVDLADIPHNVFRNMLLRHVETMEQKLAHPTQTLNAVSTRALTL